MKAYLCITLLLILGSSKAISDENKNLLQLSCIIYKDYTLFDLTSMQNNVTDYKTT